MTSCVMEKRRYMDGWYVRGMGTVDKEEGKEYKPDPLEKRKTSLPQKEDHFSIHSFPLNPDKRDSIKKVSVPEDPVVKESGNANSIYVPVLDETQPSTENTVVKKKYHPLFIRGLVICLICVFLTAMIIATGVALDAGILLFLLGSILLPLGLAMTVVARKEALAEPEKYKVPSIWIRRSLWILEVILIIAVLFWVAGFYY